MSNSAVLGQYLWHELLTTDPKAGADFYGKVFGWKKLPYEGEPGYVMLGTAQGPVGGVRVVGKDPLAQKAGQNWLTYVGVPDLTAALAVVEAQGGRVIHPVTPLPADGGRYAVIADPQGAIIGVFEPGARMSGDNAPPTAGPMSWHELTAEDPQAALKFYKAIFGWDVVATHAMGGDVGTYYLFGLGTTQMGGVFTRGSQLAPSWPRWLVYLSVPSVTAAVEATLAAGGKVVNGPHEVPGGTWIAQVIDSHGIPMAVNGPKEAAAAAPKPRPKPKAKAKTKVKAKTMAKSKVKAKAQGKAKVKPKKKVAVKSKSRAKSKGSPKKTKAKAKAKAKTKAKTKAKSQKRSPRRKAPRRGK